MRGKADYTKSKKPSSFGFCSRQQTCFQHMFFIFAVGSNNLQILMICSLNWNV